jgi:hypothetical protein
MKPSSLRLLLPLLLMLLLLVSLPPLVPGLVLPAAETVEHTGC